MQLTWWVALRAKDYSTHVNVTWTLDEGSPPAPSWLLDRESHPVVRALGLLRTGSTDWSTIISEYQAQSQEWLSWTASVPGYFTPIERACEFVDIPGPSEIVELCSGSSPVPNSILPLSKRTLIDGSEKMLKAADPSTHRVCAMVDALPLRSGCAALVIVLNGTLHIDECNRILSDQGCIVIGWTFGEYTPMYQSWAHLLSRVPDDWTVALGRGKWGEFGILCRS